MSSFLGFSTTPISQGPPTEPVFPEGIIYSMATFGAIVAGGVLVWSNKKLKAVQDSQIATEKQSQSRSKKRSPI